MTHGILPTAALHTGRVLLASLFILGGINKILNYEATALTMGDMGIPFVSLLLPATIALEFVGGMAVAVGRTGAAFSAFLLFAYTLAVNLIFHRFWEMQGQMGQVELSLFFKNVSLAGGMLYLAAQDVVQRDEARKNSLGKSA